MTDGTPTKARHEYISSSLEAFQEARLIDGWYAYTPDGTGRRWVIWGPTVNGSPSAVLSTKEAELYCDTIHHTVATMKTLPCGCRPTTWERITE